MYTDKQIIEVINLLQEGEGDESQLAYWMGHELKGLEIIFNLIFHSKEDFSGVFIKVCQTGSPIIYL